MNSTTIEWTDRTWNPVTGCTKVSPGCDHCYADSIATRFAGTKAFPHGFEVTLRPDRLAAPLQWSKPSRVFVNSMSDLFHDDVPDEFIARVWAVMAASPRHTFQVLTKRHGRMRSLLSSAAFRVSVGAAIGDLELPGPGRFRQITPEQATTATTVWPLPNVWLGVSVEDQKRAELRVPALLEAPAAVRFLSCEPLLGPVDLLGPWHPLKGRSKPTYWLTPQPVWGDPVPVDGTDLTLAPLEQLPAIDWVIAGGESGPKARPMHPAWPRALRDQCAAAGVPFFFKQWGRWSIYPATRPDGLMDLRGRITVADDGTVYQPGDLAWPDGPRAGEAVRAGHDRAQLTAMYPRRDQHTRELDERTHDAFPDAPSSTPRSAPGAADV
ncbi:phage Gp37/Gp68 family protein [Pseudonocardia kongjuensis]|uniref:Phage Gp37/Gp68 family protein n=1 Tax=Pseudonocardia kongjuensis TaxID=102227 RepID=A0ABP4IXQ2_9PSEU